MDFIDELEKEGGLNGRYSLVFMQWEEGRL